MTQDYTQNDLIRYLYKDMPVTDYFEIEDAIENDSVLKKAFSLLFSSYKSLPKVSFCPSRKVLNRIIRYSHSLSPKAHC